MKFDSYIDVTGAEHQARFTKLSEQGYRLISISVYGNPSSPRYAAAWVQRGGPAWQAVHGVDATKYQSAVDKWTAEGYAPVLVSATGAFAHAVFAAVFEKGVKGEWQARHGLPAGPAGGPDAFQQQNALERGKGLILRSATIYGTASDRRYAAVWHSNPTFVKWHLHPAEPGAGYQAVFDAEVQLPGVLLSAYRPAQVALSEDQVYCASFRDDFVGEWAASHGLSATAYENERRRQAEKGRYPIGLQGGGVGARARFAAIFAKQDVPAERVWTATGTAIPELTGFDGTMKSFMVSHGVRAAQLAIAREGVMQLSRAYTWAEPAYRITQPSDRFLLASCSKMFLAAAVQSLYDAKKLQTTTKVYPLLGFSGPADARSDEITVQQLLDHTGGYDDGKTGSQYDPTYSMRQIAEALNLGGPVTKLDVARYMYEKYNLDFAPGGPEKYSNYGYLLASAVVEHVTGQDYFAYLNGAVLAPAGLGEVAVSSTLAAGRPRDQAIAEDPGLGLSPLDLKSTAPVPAVYGGDQEIKEVSAAPAGLACSAQAMVRFIHTHAAWGNGGRMVSAREGSTPGASTFARSNADGVDWAVVFNTRDWPREDAATYKRLIAADPSLPGSIERQLADVKVIR